MLFVDVNLGSVSERITVMKGDTAEALTEEFSIKHDLDAGMKVKLRNMLQQQIDGILEKIDEEDHTSQNTGEGSEIQNNTEDVAQYQNEQEEEAKFAAANQAQQH